MADRSEDRLVTQTAFGRVRWQNGCRMVKGFFPPENSVGLDSERSDLNLFDVATESGSPLKLANVRSNVFETDVAMFAAPRPGRCSDGSFGVWYAGSSLDVALDETLYHYEHYMASIDNEPDQAVYRALMFDIDLDLHDVSRVPGMRDPDDYTSARKAAAKLREEGSDGVVWESVRSPGSGRCIGLFRPEIVPKTTMGPLLEYYWDGRQVGYVKRLDTGEIIRSAS